MAAWRHTQYWTDDRYNAYRSFVAEKAPGLKGDEKDCADLSLKLIVEFAFLQGLPLTFTDNEGVLYISKGGRQTNIRGKYIYSHWGDGQKDAYLHAVRNRIGSQSLYNVNTVVNANGPQAGDLLSAPGHTALVFNSFDPGQIHPKSTDKSIKNFPGSDAAASELNVLEYFRDVDGRYICPKDGVKHFDYLNHRGVGQPVKQKAELIYFARVDDPDLAGFTFRKFAPSVLQSWSNWDGNDDPPGYG